MPHLLPVLLWNILFSFWEPLTLKRQKMPKYKLQRRQKPMRLRTSCIWCFLALDWVRQNLAVMLQDRLWVLQRQHKMLAWPLQINQTKRSQDTLVFCRSHWRIGSTSHTLQQHLFPKILGSHPAVLHSDQSPLLLSELHRTTLSISDRQFKSTLRFWAFRSLQFYSYLNFKLID